jgi:aryl-alcohol dehydrogenase-like predicted oxidoreductase
VLAALDEIVAAHHATVAAVALGWLLARPRVVAPIASARTTKQLDQALPAATLTLTPAEIDRLSATTQSVRRPAAGRYPATHRSGSGSAGRHRRTGSGEG